MATTLHVLGWIAGLVPRAVGLPETIAPTDTFSAAGAGAMVGSLIRRSAPPAFRVSLMRRWSLLLFAPAVALYGFAVTYPLL